MSLEAKTQFVMNELMSKGFVWSMDLEDAAADAVRVADGKDTARKIAGKVAAKMKATVK